MTFAEIWESIKAWLTSESLWNTLAKILIALIIIFISFKIINAFSRRIERLSEKKNADKTIMKTLAYIVKLSLKVLVLICMIGFLGIDTSGLTALVASFGVCIGLAVNGALSNLAGGVLLIVTRPFRVDDYIEAQGYAGTVLEIRITNTKIVTPDNKIIYIPNGALSSGPIVNYSEKDLRRVDLKFSISYEDDLEKAKKILTMACESHQLVCKDPAPFIRVAEYAANSIDIHARAWTKNEDYWTVYFDLLESIKKDFDANGIKIPYNQLDVHIKKDL